MIIKKVILPLFLRYSARKFFHATEAREKYKTVAKIRDHKLWEEVNAQHVICNYVFKDLSGLGLPW